MDDATRPLRVGFPRMQDEAGERRDFLPPLLARLIASGAEVVAEKGIGSGMGYADEDYLALGPQLELATHEEAFAQDIVVVLRCPEEREMDLIGPGATLVSMLHFPTRPERVARLRRQGLEAISIDCIEDDDGNRLVEESDAVAWNALEAAFDTLRVTYPAMDEPNRPPVRVTIMGAGSIGRHAVEAATKFGNRNRADELLAAGVPGVEVVTIGRNLTNDPEYMKERLRLTDVLVDTTQRSDPSVPLIPNAWIDLLPEHAVICDCVVDPYQPDTDPPTVRGIEGIPQGNLDTYVFLADDPAWEATVPNDVPHANRRAVVSCYSWPGVHPEPCMEIYGAQLAPLFETLIECGGVAGVRPDGRFHERALARASLRYWREPD